MKSCPFCKSEMATRDCKDKRYLECSHCCFRCVPSEDHPGMDQARQRYLKHDNTPENTGYCDWLKNILIGGVLPFLKETGTLLDYGCGSGSVTENLFLGLTGGQWKYTGYDLHFHPQKPEGLFSAILVCEVAEHFSDPLMEWDTLNRYLDTQSILTLSTLFAPRDFDQFSKWWYRRDMTHIAFYTRETLEQIARHYGYVILADNGKNLMVFRKGA